MSNIDKAEWFYNLWSTMHSCLSFLAAKNEKRVNFSPADVKHKLQKHQHTSDLGAQFRCMMGTSLSQHIFCYQALIVSNRPVSIQEFHFCAPITLVHIPKSYIITTHLNHGYLEISLKHQTLWFRVLRYVEYLGFWFRIGYF